MNQTSLKRTAAIKVLLSLLVLGAIVVAEVIAVVIVIFLDLPDTSLMATIIPEAAGAAAAVLGFVLLGGKDWTSTSKDDIVYTFRFGWSCVAISLVMMVMELLDYASSGIPIGSDAALRFIEVALMCLLIGIFEEFMFRGVIFQALLAVLGGTHGGVVIAVMLASFFFGCAHIDFSTDFVEPLMAVQGICKIVQTGMYSILLCVIVLRTHKFGGVSLFHAFDDFVLIFPSVALFNEEMSTEYVTSGDEAFSTIVFYLIIIALYTPFTVKALLELHKGQDVYRGVFMEPAVARAQQEAYAQGMIEGSGQGPAPVASSGPVMPNVQMAYATPSEHSPYPNSSYSGAMRSGGFERAVPAGSIQQGATMQPVSAQAQWVSQPGQMPAMQQWQATSAQPYQGQAQYPNQGYGVQQRQAAPSPGMQPYQTGMQQYRPQGPETRQAQVPYQAQAPATQQYQVATGQQYPWPIDQQQARAAQGYQQAAFQQAQALRTYQQPTAQQQAQAQQVYQQPTAQQQARALSYQQAYQQPQVPTQVQQPQAQGNQVQGYYQPQARTAQPQHPAYQQGQMGVQMRQFAQPYGQVPTGEAGQPSVPPVQAQWTPPRSRPNASEGWGESDDHSSPFGS